MRTLTTTIFTTLLLAASGCTQLSRPEQAEQGERCDPQVFLHEHLQKEPAVTVAEAYRAIIMLAEGEDSFTSFDQREAWLLERKIVRLEWHLQRTDCIDRGSVAYMIVQVLKIRGGVDLRILGRAGLGDRRYAVRELVYRDIMTQSPPYRFMTGGELVDVIAHADDYMAARKMYPSTPVKIDELVGTRPAG
jgi:hypothetical protein